MLKCALGPHEGAGGHRQRRRQSGGSIAGIGRREGDFDHSLWRQDSR